MQPLKCTTKLIEQVRLLIERGMSWQAIAEVVGVHKSTLFNWRDPHSQEFKEDFVAMVAEAKENFGSTKTKQGQLTQSVKHTLTRTVFELRDVDLRSLSKKEKEEFPEMRQADKDEKRKFPEKIPPPMMPPSWFPKPYLIDYADQVLDLTLDPKSTIPEMRAECLLRIQELTVTVRVAMVSEQEVDPSNAAVKLVLNNCGPKDSKWNIADEIDHGLKSDTLLDIAARMGANVKKG